jgi:S1-C subfamily serine protease
MEHLTKQQIVLLTLLVSFVSSIATGIVTVSLLDQAPPAVTQTINRVVERTIEKVATASTSTPQVIRETIVVKDDQAVVSAIAKASPSIVRIYARYNGASDSDYLGLGVIVSTKGALIAHVSTADRYMFGAVLDGGNTVPLTFVNQDPTTGLALFQAEQSTNPVEARAYVATPLGDSDGVKLGQGVIAIGGQSESTVLSGTISSIVRGGTVRPTGMPAVSSIRSSITDEDFLTHSILVNLAGEVVGFKSGFSRDDGYIPSGTAEEIFGKSF